MSRLVHKSPFRHWVLLAVWLVGSSGCTHELTVFSSGPEALGDAGQPPETAPDAASPGSPDASATDDGGAVPEDDAGLPASFGPSIAAFQHTCVISQGRLACWGDNSSLQLGLGDRAPRETPQEVSAFSDFVEVCAGEAHSCALRSAGQLLCWGENFNGELGVGDRDPRDRPSPVGGTPFVHLACGGRSTCAIALDGALYCWGDNREGQLGQDDFARGTEELVRPTRVAPQLAFRKVSVGQAHVCGVTGGGQLYCWGRNSAGQLGVGPEEMQIRKPTRVDPQRLYHNVATGMSHTCAISSTRQLLCWGSNLTGRLGLGSGDEKRIDTPTLVGTESNYVDVQAQWFQSCALRENGFLSCWGRNTEGQLGVSDTVDRLVPTRVGTEDDWLEVTTGQFHSCGVRKAGVFCWGENDEANQLGLGMPGRRSEPASVTLP